MQTSDLQQRLAGPRKHTEKIALFSARLRYDLRPQSTIGPTHRRARGRKVQLRRRLDAMLPLFSGDFESDVFETRQRGDEIVVQLQLAVISIFVGRECGHDAGELFWFE